MLIIHDNIYMISWSPNDLRVLDGEASFVSGPD